MSRETENIVLLLVAISIAVITVSGAFTRYVKPGLLPWLAASAVLLVALALVAVVGDIRRGGPRTSDQPGDHCEAHSHRTGIVWLLVVPILVLIVVAPPALRPSAAAPSVTAVSNVVLNRFPFPPLPPGNAPEVSLPEVLNRAALDSTGSLTNRCSPWPALSSTGAGREPWSHRHHLLRRRRPLARVHLRGRGGRPRRRTHGEHLRVGVDGQVTPAPWHLGSMAIPTLQATAVARVDAPANPYA